MRASLYVPPCLIILVIFEQYVKAKFLTKKYDWSKKYLEIFCSIFLMNCHDSCKGVSLRVFSVVIMT